MADLGEFHGRPSSPAGEGNIGIDHGEAVCFGQADDIFIVQIMSEDSGDGMEIGEVAVVEDTIVDEPDGGEAHRRHEIIRLGFADQRAGGIHLDMGLGNHRGEFFVFRIDGESLQAIGRLREKHGMEAHSCEIITERAEVYAVIEALDPAPLLLVVVNLMFGPASFALGDPGLKKAVVVENVAMILGPFSEGLASGAVGGSETAQLAELLRELRDFR